MQVKELSATIEQIAIPGRGILAADESTNTIGKRFNTINLENTEENRRKYRNLLVQTKDLENYISGVILYSETLGQKDDAGDLIPLSFAKKSIVPGIKVDLGLESIYEESLEKKTNGIIDLSERLSEYKKSGVKFAKWRAVFNISDNLPSDEAIHINSELLASYAAICQEHSIVPIVEPEVLMDGDHTLERCSEVTTKVLTSVFNSLDKHQVKLEYIILKPNMVIAGQDCKENYSIEDVAKETVKVLKNTVPSSVPTINFLSGGQSSELATKHLNAMNKLGDLPWNLSFSYGRALQSNCIAAWEGAEENIPAAQKALLQDAMNNSKASRGSL